ncbi:MAG: permease-like cell division protein FtsX [Oscillospiraceae bacterium]|nr:permease-like cell division protein FtsX [Oscillospiraceae bacterium]
MRSGSLRYLFREGVRSVWVNRLMSAASVGVLSACLMLIGSAVLLAANVKSMVGFVGQQNEIIVVVSDSVTDAQLAELDDTIKGMEELASVKFTSKEQALISQIEIYGESLLAGFEEDNPYPDMYSVTVKNIGDVERVSQTLAEMPEVEQVRSPEEFADVLVSIEKMVTVMGALVVIVLAVVSLVIISNTIRIAVFNRRREVNIMKYVGARDSFIRLPFVIQGVFFGILSALIAFFVVWAGYSFIYALLAQNGSPWIAQAAASIIPFETIWLPLLVSFGGAGIVTGMIGSLLSLRKHLKV